MIDILGTLDEKIENNHKKIEDYKAILLKEYLILLSKNDVQKGCIGELASVKSGYAFKSSDWAENGIKVIKIKNITDTGEIDFSDCSFISSVNIINKASSFIVKGGELVVAMTGATIGKMALVPNIAPYCLVNQRVGLFFPNGKSKCSPFLYASCLREDVSNDIIIRGGGSAQPNISGQSIEAIEIPMINATAIKLFDEKYGIILDSINKLIEINEKTKQLKQLYLKKFFG